ncbi:MAG TPA: endonuclease III domain-containing protein [Candidatus Acetothermia bacterium]|nr:endonuclease III domain-containing protein [Candidatus Acetothermia bacterium]
MAANLTLIYNRLFSAYGEQHWWPGSDPFEIIVGAILTQQVAWKNVEKAIAALKSAGLMAPEKLLHAPLDEVAALIRPTIYYNEKAKKLRSFLVFLQEQHHGDLSDLLSLLLPALREELLSVHGIGEETADSIILYAAEKPSFVIDAYTRRIMQRLGLISGTETYAALRALFMQNIPADVKLYNEYHALFVRHGKERCRSRAPLCSDCPLRDVCNYAATAQ